MKLFFQHRSILFFSILKILILLFLFAILYKLLIPRVNAFGCFDDCFNIGAGYLLNRGFPLYSRIFFNHAPFMAYLSFFIQTLFHPQNLFELILRHRQIMLLIAFISNLVLVIRFGWKLLLFTVLYEFSKFYIFGDRFLAEGLVVYFFVYMLCVLWYQNTRQKTYLFDRIFSALLTFFIIFFREPYALAALALFVSVISTMRQRNQQLVSIGVFLFLVLVELLSLPLKDFYQQVFSINSTFFSVNEHGESVVSGINLLKIFFYPVVILISGTMSLFRIFEIGLSLIFLILFGYEVFVERRYILAGCLFVILGLANIRFVDPGSTFYASFHMLPWFSLFIASIVLMTFDGLKKNTQIGWGFLGVIFVLFSFFLFSKSSYIFDHPNEQAEFLTNYGTILSNGEIVKTLSQPTDSFFADGFDEAIYWQANRASQYPYTWYTSIMPQVNTYRDARTKMFETNPPKFYYGSCPRQADPNQLLGKFKEKYINLTSRGNPTCLFVLKTELPHITQSQWQAAHQWLIDIPQTSGIQK